MKRPSGETLPPYVVTYTDTADAEWEAAYTFFASRNQPAAERWLVQVTKSLAFRAADHAALPGRRYLAGDYDEYGGRDTHAMRVGAYRIIYELVDEDEDGLIDTLRVLHFRPAAQNTLTSDEDE